MTVALREWILEDAPPLAKFIDNPNVQNNLRDGIPYPYTEKDAEEYIKGVLSQQPGTIFARAILADGSVVGSISVSRKDNVHRLTAELGYFLAEPYWGRGITSEAIRQITAFIFSNTDIVRIFAEPYAYNIASCRALEKAGYVYEGTLRKNAIKNGKFLDMKMYAIIKPDDDTENG